MADTAQTKSKKEPTVLQALGVGSLIGLIASAIVFWEVRRTFMENTLDIRNSLPGFSAVLLVCILGAFAGRAKGKTSKAMWIGATIPLLIRGLLGLIGGLLFPGY